MPKTKPTKQYRMFHIEPADNGVVITYRLDGMYEDYRVFQANRDEANTWIIRRLLESMGLDSSGPITAQVAEGENNG